MQIAAWPGFGGEIDGGMERTHEGNTAREYLFEKRNFVEKEF